MLSTRPQQWTSEQARAAGRIGGRVTGASKVRELSSDEARRRVNVRWQKRRAEARLMLASRFWGKG